MSARRLALIVAICAAALLLPLAAHAIDDVADPIFRFGGGSTATIPGGVAESIDPQTGILSVAHTDLSLPGAGGFDLNIKRVYRSKLWGRADPTSVVDANLAAKEKSAVGWGWQVHMGRLRNPTGASAASPCDASFPTFETPDGATMTFYRGPLSGLWHSKEHHVLGTCGTGKYCVWTDRGVRYEFSESGAYYYGTQTIEQNRILPASAVVGPEGQTISVAYVPGSAGALSSISDTLGRIVNFQYDAATQRITRIDYTTGPGTTASITYGYASVATSDWGTQRFLSTVTPPVGPAWQYAYNHAGTVGSNKHALSQLTYPGGATLAYTYAAVSFNAGYQAATFSPVMTRVQGGRAPASTSSYVYASAPGNPEATTTITRPDGLQDVHRFRTWAGITQGEGWRVGLPISSSIGNGAQVQELTWERGNQVWNGVPTGAPVPAPNWGGCTPGAAVVDPDVYTANLSTSVLRHGGAVYRTEYFTFDQFGQPQLTRETGVAGHQRTTQTSYEPRNPYALNWTGPPGHLVRGLKSWETVSDAAGTVASEWLHDANGRLLRETKAGASTAYAYDGVGNVVRATDADGKYVVFGNYTWGKPTTFDHNGRFTSSQTVSQPGWIMTRTDGRGFVTTSEYDAGGRLTATIPPIGAQLRYEYAPDGTTIATRRRPPPGQGAEVVMKTAFLDGLGRTTMTRDAANAESTTTFDALGRVAFQSYPHAVGAPAPGDTFTYDALSRPRRTTHSDGTYRETTYGWDAGMASVMVTQRNERGYSSYTFSRGFGSPETDRLWRARDVNGVESIYTYNTLGSPTVVDVGIVDGANNYDRTFLYDPRGNLIEETSAERGVVSYGRSTLGKLNWVTDGRGTTAFGYDELGRVRTIDYPAGTPDVTYEYDNNGNVRSTVGGAGGSSSYTYDELDRMTNHTFTMDGVSYSSAVGYNGVGCQTSRTYPTGTVVTMGCDTLNRTNLINGYVTSAAYHPSGQLQSYALANGRTVSLSYDPRARMTGVDLPGIVTLSYGYDANGNVQTHSSLYTGQLAANRSMTYDPLDRLIAMGSGISAESFDYDAIGNRRSKSDSGANTIYQYVGGRLASATGAEPDTFTYTPAGDLLSRAGMSFTWDGAGRLTGTSDGSSYVYAPDGQRVKRVTSLGSEVFHHEGKQLLSVTRPNGAKIRDYVYLAGRMVALHGRPE